MATAAAVDTLNCSYMNMLMEKTVKQQQTTTM